MGKAKNTLLGLLLGASSLLSSPNVVERQIGWEGHYIKPISTPITVNNGHAWFGAGNTLHAVDARSGLDVLSEETGENPLPAGMTENFNVRSIVHADIDEDPEKETIVALGDGRVSLYDLKEGKYENTKIKVAKKILGGAAVINKTIVVTGYDGKVFGLGKKGWEFDTEDLIYGRPVVAKDKVLVATDRGLLYCLNSQGKVQWKQRYSELYSAGSWRINVTPYVRDGMVVMNSLQNLNTRSGMKTFDLETGIEGETLHERIMFDGFDLDSERIFKEHRKQFMKKVKALRKKKDSLLQVGEHENVLFYGTKNGLVGIIQ
ncbi:MAG: PQQ-binding-like beta-propeller repeat protein [Candidatus Nanoarchaeia archaeon]